MFSLLVKREHGEVSFGQRPVIGSGLGALPKSDPPRFPQIYYPKNLSSTCYDFAGIRLQNLLKLSFDYLLLYSLFS